MPIANPVIQEALREVQRQINGGVNIPIKATPSDLKSAPHGSASGQQIPHSARMRRQERGESNLRRSQGKHTLGNHAAHGVSDEGDFGVQKLLLIV